MKDPRRSRELFSIFFSLMLCKLIIGQTPASTTAIDRERGYQQRLALQSQSLVANLDIRNVGPSVFSGRVVDLEVSPADPSIFYVAYASGGLWKTINNGTSFTPLFDQEMVMTIGDIAVDWKNNIIWVGTGENNASRSSYAGFGMYRSSDEGITWEQKGLKDSHHTGRIILHPNDPKILWVAMSGHLYSDNPERGIFKSTDGGDTWHKTLYLSEGTGAIELLSDPSNPYILYAALWERSRKAWDFQEAGTGSGLYKSVDGGDTWNKISGGESGFPDGVGVGRIGLTMTRQNGKSYLYALLDNYFRRPAAEDDKSRDLTKNDLRNMSRDDFLALNDKELKRFLRQNRFPRKYNVQLIKSMVAENTIEPQALVEYLEDANNLLFDTPIVGAEVYLSTDDGLTWTRTHEDNIDRFYNTYGYYFGQIRVAPQDPNKLYILGVPILRSIDAGKTWKSINRDNVHVDHHALWVNPDRPGHLILGNDGGVNISYDDGSTWSKNNAPAVGQFYAIAIDKDEPYHVYGGTQDNGVWEGPSTYKQGVAWQSSGAYPYESIIRGDGMQVEVDWRDNNTIYTGYQFGNYFRVNKRTGKRKSISPKHDLGDRPFRFNWQSPILLSRHNQDILYMGSNRLHRSMNQGEDWTLLSGDLTQGGKSGDVSFGTLTCISESTFQFGLLYVGSDDGVLHTSQDGGQTWTNISAGLPPDLWISRVTASAHVKERVYCSLNGYRRDDFEAYIYVSNDMGQIWRRIGGNLPVEPVNVIKEDPVNPDLVYVGTDHGLYISLDGGTSFMAMSKGLAQVAIHDVIVHPEAHELVIGTHGRSIYIADVEQLQKLDSHLLAKDIHLFPLTDVEYRPTWGRMRSFDPGNFSEPSVDIPVYLKQDSEVSIEISLDETLVAKWEDIGENGLNYFSYDLSLDEEVADQVLSQVMDQDDDFEWPDTDSQKKYLPKGDYKIKVYLSDHVQDENVLTVK